MNTRMEIVLVNVAPKEARRLCDAALALAVEMESRLSRHMPGSDIARINAEGAAAPVAVDEQTFGILCSCEAMRRATGGYFDIAALCGQRTRPAYSTDRAQRTVKLASPSAMLDLGGFAKGYALDRIGRELEAAGVQSALLNFGDSSILAVGTHPFGDCWPVKAGTDDVPLRDCSLSVSGKTPSGAAHIIDPLTGRPVGTQVQVAVLGRSAAVCEILSTALYAAPHGQREAIAADFEGYTYKIINTNG